MSDSEGKKKVAVFDIDGTVYRWSLFLELVEELVEHGIFPKEAREAYEAEHTDWLNRQGDYQTYLGKVIEMFGKYLKGVPFADAERASRVVIAEKKDRVYRYTRDLIQKLKGEGYFMLAISHSPSFIARDFGETAGFDKVYGFFYETGPNDAFTGGVVDEDVIRNKASVLQRAIRKEGLTLEGSVGVGDTETDIPMLEMVETPIAFNPNRALYEHAKKRGWKIVVERKDVVYDV